MIRFEYSPLMARLWTPNVSHAWPDVDISETDDGYVFNFEIPGAVKDDIKIWLENDVLTVSGEKKSKQMDGSNKLISERSFGKFERSFKMPSGVDRNKVTAEIVDGILVVAVPKTAETKAREIEIK
jgi:HSP20 family protein